MLSTKRENAMYDPVASLRSARRQLDLPVTVDPVAGVRVVLGRVRKLLAEHLPGMGCDHRFREALSTPMKEPALERERLFALGWLRWLDGDLTAAESLLAEVERRCAAAPAEEPPAADLPALEPGLLLARSAYWCARVRVLLGRPDAIAGYEPLLRRLGGLPRAAAWYVDLLWRAGRVDRAEQVWKSVRGNKRVLGCDEGPLLEARGHLRKGDLGGAEKLLREASPACGVVWVERQLLLVWALAGLGRASEATEALRMACEGPYPTRALAEWGALLVARLEGGPVSVGAAALPWRDFAQAQRLRAEGKRPEALALYRATLGHPAAHWFGRFGLACLGEDDPAAVLAAAPGLFFALRCRVLHGIERFRRRDIGPADLLDVLGQASHAGTPGGGHFRRLAEALENRSPAAGDLLTLVAQEHSPAAQRNAGRIVLEVAARRLGPAEALPVLAGLTPVVQSDPTLREALGRQLVRLALLLSDPAVLDEAARHLPGNPLLALAQSQFGGEDSTEGPPSAAGILRQAARRLGTGSVDELWQEKGAGVRDQPRYRAVAQALRLQEAASRSDLAAVEALLEEVGPWRGFRAGPPRFVLRALEALAGAHPSGPLWRRCLPRWLQLWDVTLLGPSAQALACVAGMDVGATGGQTPPGIQPAAWLLHQAARALAGDDAIAALAFIRQALADPTAELPSAEVVRAALPDLERRADAQALARCLDATASPAALLTDLVDLLQAIPEGHAILQAARDGESAVLHAEVGALRGRDDLPGRLHHHLALLAWRSAQHCEEQDDALRAALLWHQAWRSWLGLLASAEGPPEPGRGLLLDHLLGTHARWISDLLARCDLERARAHWDLVRSLPSQSAELGPRVEKFRDDLATDYLVATREAMRHGAIPEGWRADYDRGLTLLCRLLSLDRDNVRLLTAVVQVWGEWFLDLYHVQDGPRLREQVARCTPLALQLARLVADRPDELPARSALSEVYKFRGFVEEDLAAKVALYQEALRLDPANGNVRELLAGLGVSPPAPSPPGSDDA
jgi:hypothetical protein